MNEQALRTRLQRAVRDVAARYTIVADDPTAQPTTFTLRGGSATWRVAVDPTGAARPSCTCPDFIHRGEGDDGYRCKHILAVLLGQPALRAQLLDALL